MQDSQGNQVELTVSELSGAVKRQIEDGFGRVRVRGELGRVARPASGHVYFDLKDDKAVLAAIMWKGHGGADERAAGTGLGGYFDRQADHLSRPVALSDDC